MNKNLEMGLFISFITKSELLENKMMFLIIYYTSNENNDIIVMISSIIKVLFEK